MTQEGRRSDQRLGRLESPRRWGASDGPISNFSAKGVTATSYPTTTNCPAAPRRAVGKSEGQMVGNEARGLEAAKRPPASPTTPHEKGVVKELQQMAAAGPPGRQDARLGPEDSSQTPPPKYDDTKMQYLKDWQQRLRQQAEHVAGQLRSCTSPAQPGPGHHRHEARGAAGKDGVRRECPHPADGSAGPALRRRHKRRDTALQVDRRRTPRRARRPILDAGRAVPQEYHNAVRRYFENLIGRPLMPIPRHARPAAAPSSGALRMVCPWANHPTSARGPNAWPPLRARVGCSEDCASASGILPASCAGL